MINGNQRGGWEGRHEGGLRRSFQKEGIRRVINARQGKKAEGRKEEEKRLTKGDQRGEWEGGYKEG